MPEQTLTCPTCGKTGTVTEKLVQPAMGVGMMLMTGLDPDNCDDCCETLNSHGFAVVNARQVSPGAWALTPHE